MSSASGGEDIIKKSISREQERGRVKGYEVKHASKFNALRLFKYRQGENGQNGENGENGEKGENGIMDLCKSQMFAFL